MSNSVELINFKNVLKSNSTTQKIKSIIKEKLYEIEISKFKMQPDLILFICRMVWSLSLELKMKDRTDDVLKNITIELYNTIYTLSPQENEQLKQQIDFFINNKQIKPISLKKKFFKYLTWFLKKLI